MNYDGAYPYLESTDQLHDVPPYSRDLAERLQLPAPVGKYYPSSGSDFPISSGWSPITTLGRIDYDAQIPAGSPHGTTELCLLVASVQVNSKGSGADWVKIAPAVATELGAYADPPATSHTATYQSIMAHVTPRQSTFGKTWILNLAGKTSIRLMYTSNAIASLSYSQLDLIPLRLVMP